jgi:hypothetical protein
MTSPTITAIFYVSLSVAIDTPRHFHRCNTGNTVHCFYGTMTFLTFQPCLDVPLMREVNKIGNIVHFNPRYGFTIFPVGYQLQNIRPFSNAGYKFVTSNTFAHAGDTSDRRPVRIVMTALARNLIVRRMHFVTKIDWLNRAAIRIIFAVNPYAHQQSKYYHEYY